MGILLKANKNYIVEWTYEGGIAESVTLVPL